MRYGNGTFRHRSSLEPVCVILSVVIMMSILIFLCFFYPPNALSDPLPEVESVTCPVIHGEGPYWDDDKQVLYFVDIMGQTVNQYNPKTKESRSVRIDGGPVSLVIPVAFEDEFIIGRGLDIVRVGWDGNSSTPSYSTVLSSIDSDKPRNRFNDGKVDSSGRLWAGTMGPESPVTLLNQGSLYSFDPFDDFKAVKQLSPVTISNGLAWNANDSLMYYIDSVTRKVDVFDFDLIKGTIENRRTLFHFGKNNISGVPDGMAIDENDNLWVANYGGAAILHIETNNGNLLNRINFPVSKITSCAFGGPRLETLFVTSSRVGMTDFQLQKEPEAGSLFKVSNIGVKGQSKSNKIRLFSSAN